MGGGRGYNVAAKPTSATRENNVPSVSGISSRTLSYASQTPFAEDRINAGILNRSAEMLMRIMGTASTSVNAERIRRATDNMRRRFGYIR